MKENEEKLERSTKEVYEGTNTVKNSKIQRITSDFGTIRMKENETFTEFHSRLKKHSNSLYNLDEIILEHHVVKKILRSLPKWFIPKITAIKESKDLNSLKENELLGSLQTFEADVLSKSLSQKKDKNNAFKAQ